MGIYNYIEDNNIKQPVQLEISIDKVSHNKMARYMTVKIEGQDVTQMVAEAVGLKISQAKDTYGSLIIHGVGMDMCFALQSMMYRHAYQNGYPDMFDSQFYKFITDEKRKIIDEKEEDYEDYEP